MTTGAAPNGVQATLAEVVVQGVRRFSEVRRVPLKPGYNVIYGLTDSGKSTVYDVMRSLLFARPAEGEGESFRSFRQDASPTCRAGLTISAGGQLFRIMKDYSTGGTNLSKLDTAQNKFILMLDSPPAIRRWLREALRVPAGPEFGRLFTLDRADIPSMNLSDRQRPKPGAEFEAEVASMSLQDKKALCDKLLKDYQDGKELVDVERELDTHRSRLEELDQIMAKAAKLEHAVESALKSFDEMSLKAALPADIEEKVAEYEKAVREYEARRNQLAPEDYAFGGPAHATPPPLAPPQEPWREPIGIAGGAGALITFIAMVVLSAPARTVAILLFLASLGVIGWRVFLWIRAQEEYSATKNTRSKNTEQLRMLEKGFEADTAVIRGYLKQYDVKKTDDLLEMHADRSGREHNLQEARKLLDEFAEKNELSKARDEKAELDPKVEAMGERVNELGGGGHGIGPGVTREQKLAQIARLENDIAAAEGRRPRPPSAIVGDADVKDELYADVDDDPAVAAIERYCAARSAERGVVLRAIQETFSRNLEAFTGGIWKKAVFHSNGRVSVRQGGGGTQAPVPMGSLTVDDRDAVYAALRYSLLQLEARSSVPPIVLLDDPFDFDEGRSELLGRALQTLGKNGQVLHFTSQPSLTHFADHSVAL